MKIPGDLATELRATLGQAVAALDELLAGELPEGPSGRLRAARERQVQLLRALDEATALLRRSGPLTPAPADPEAATVLLVGDDGTREGVAAVLSPHFRLREAGSAADARAEIGYAAPDLILADGDAGGLSLCRALKRDRNLAAIPVVLLTGMPGRDSGDAGADDIVVEPFHAEELVSRLRNLVALRQKERMLVATLDELRERRRTLDEDLQQARSLQLALLPRTRSSRELRVEAVYRPADVVGGDLCDIHVAGRRQRFFLADTTGHGLRASLQTMVVKTAWDRHKAAALGPGDALARLNDEFFNIDPGLRTRLAGACFDVELPPTPGSPARLTYSTAGHPPLVHARDGKASELWLPGTFVGLLRGATFEEATVELLPGDRVIAFTDGLVEQFTATGDRVDEDAIMASLAQPGTLADVIALTLRLLERATGGAPPPDDITLIAVELPR